VKTEKIGTRSVVFTQFVNEWGCGLNIHLILGEHRNYLIDTGFGSEDMNEIKAYLGDDTKPLVVINTHFHWDHIWGNHCFDNELIISHRKCRQMIEETWNEMLNDHKHFVKGEAKLKLPNLIFDDELYFPDDKIKLFYTPGHSIDGISVFDEIDGVLNAGDNIGDTVEEIVPNIYSDIELYRESLQHYKQLDVNFCVSGHNVTLGKDVFERIEKELDKP
jgi:glyoxylase-like metal-dependent hydrolase (beta-lactamase superfamily II)